MAILLLDIGVKISIGSLIGTSTQKLCEHVGGNASVVPLYPSSGLSGAMIINSQAFKRFYARNELATSLARKHSTCGDDEFIFGPALLLSEEEAEPFLH